MANPLLLPFLFLFSFITSGATSNTHPSKFSAVFFFGDSTMDTGNNNYIPTIAKAKHVPYGHDFPGGNPTGRFSNGRLVPDLLSAELGLKQFSPPFLDPMLSDDDMKTGVNFGSAGTGFDEATSRIMGTIPVSKQVEMLKSYIARLTKIAGGEEASRVVASSLMFISAGSNDFLFSFYHSGNRNISEYQDTVLDKVQIALKGLYNLGGRIFVVAGLPPIGCTPFQITSSFERIANRSCVDEQNADSLVYNSKLQKLLHEMQQSLSGSKFVYMDTYGFLMEIIKDPKRYGFEETKIGCCGTGLAEIGPLCNFLSSVCRNTSSYVFYDAVHPSEEVYRQTTAYIMKNVIPLL